MKYTYTLLLLLAACAATAQNRAYNRINLSFTPEYYFNKLNLDNDGKDPNPMQVHNTTARAFGIEFEHGFRNGLTLTAGVQYGNQNHDVDIERDMSNFDADAKENLKGVVYRDAIVVSTTYIAPRILIGYRKALNSRWALAAKAGVEMKLYYNGTSPISQTTEINYRVDDGSESRTIGFLGRTVGIGKDVNNSSRPFPAKLHTFELYVGTEYSFKKGFIKNISAGLEINRPWNWKQPGDFIHIASTKSWQQPDAANGSIDQYNGRNVSLGLRLAVSLWK